MLETRGEKTLNIASPLAQVNTFRSKKRTCIVFPIIEMHAIFVEFKSNVFMAIIARRKRDAANVNFITNKTRPD